MGIEFDKGNRKLLAVNIYMPYDNRSRNSENDDELIGYLGICILLSKRVTFLVSM